MSYEFGEEGFEGPEPAVSGEIKREPGAGMRITIEATKWDEQRLAEMVLSRVADESRKHLSSAVHKQIADAIDRTVKDIVESKLASEIEAILAEGWQKTNSYGEPTGDRITFRQRVSNLIEARDNYSSERRIDKIVKETVETTLRGEFAKEVAEARAKVRAMLDGALNEKLAAALREGLGLK